MLGPVVTYSIDLVHLPEDTVLDAGDLKPCLWLPVLGDVITAVDISLTDSVVHFLVA